MRKNRDISFWRPLFITYILTCVTVIATAYIQYNIEVNDDLRFYRIVCSNHFVLSLAKVIDALVPTTTTFALTLFIVNYEKSGKDITETAMTILLITLVIAGITFTTIKDYVAFWIFIFLLVSLICGVLICCWSLCGKRDGKRRRKNEKSDGKLF